jgi:hypothetical protein
MHKHWMHDVLNIHVCNKELVLSQIQQKRFTQKMAIITWDITNDGTPGYVNVIWTVLVIVATMFYIYLGINIYRHRTQSPFDSSYFMLWINTGIVDCLTVLCNWSFYRFSGFHWLQYEALAQFDDNQMGIYFGTAVPLITYLLIVGFVSLVVSSFNRFTSMTYPLKHAKVTTLLYSFLVSRTCFRCGQIVDKALHLHYHGLWL